MNVANETPPTDYLKYFTEQLPQDLARNAEQLDELRKRQGALNACEDALKDRAAAAEALNSAKEEAENIRAEALGLLDESEAKIAVLSDREAKLTAAIADFNTACLDSQKIQDALKSSLETREKEVSFKESEVNKGQKQLVIDRTALDKRIAAFQQKVAELTA